jgi:hypothetical protein
LGIFKGEGRLEGNGIKGRGICKWISEAKCEGDWMSSPAKRVYWRALLKKIMNFRLP